MQRVNAVILDLDMPGAHGSAVIQKMKAFNRTSSIPILILSGSDDPDEIQEMLKMGADEFLEKPTDLARVEQALDALVTKAAMRQSGVLNLALAIGGKLATNPA